MKQKQMKVLVLSKSQSIMDLVQQLVGPGAEYKQAATAAGAGDVDLVVAENKPGKKASVDSLASKADTDVLYLSAKGKLLPRLKKWIPASNLGKMSYKEVTDRAGVTLVREYLESLLREHTGNVTRAAQSAKIKRESFHRLLHRHGLKAEAYRDRNRKR